MTANSLKKTKVRLIVILIFLLQVKQSFCKDVKTDSEKCAGGHSKLKNYFTWENYLVLATMLVVSCGIGFFYGFFGPKQKTSEDFLLGGSSMKTIPMSLSLATSYITAVELLGNPAEMYNFGSQFWMICVSFLLVVPLTSNLYLPVFMKLRLTSSYEYFSLRFCSKTKYIASALYILQMVFYTSVVVYAPALALSNGKPKAPSQQPYKPIVTGLNTYIAVAIVYVVCIFYASQGGMKAVIITDTFQTVVLILSILLVLFFGEHFVGGSEIILTESIKTHRVELFNMDFNPTVRHSFWSVVVGGTFYWMTMFSANQASIQKYLSVEKISQVRIALWISAVFLIFVYTCNFYTGMIMVAHYHDCDPLRAGDVTASDQLLPLYIINELGHFKGVPGLFVAGIFAASLGTVAAALNCLSAVTSQDFIYGAFNIKIPEARGALVVKILSVIYGLISFGLVFVVEQLGSVMQLAITFNGIIGGVTFGLFTLGMYFPWANSKGAISGTVIAIAFVTWIGLGNQISQTTGDLTFETKATSIENCPCLLNTTLEEARELDSNKNVFVLYRISYLWYSLIGFLITIIFGILVSYITGFEDPQTIDSNLLSPIISTRLKQVKAPKKSMTLQEKISECSKSTIMGIVNIALDIEDEIKENKEKITRKLSRNESQKSIRNKEKINTVSEKIVDDHQNSKICEEIKTNDGGDKMENSVESV